MLTLLAFIPNLNGKGKSHKERAIVTSPEQAGYPAAVSHSAVRWEK